jgi:transcription elongation factor B subunit 1
MTESDSEYVKLISSDGFEFIIHREAAIRSGTIKNMLCGPVQFRESVDNEIIFRDIK